MLWDLLETFFPTDIGPLCLYAKWSNVSVMFVKWVYTVTGPQTHALIRIVFL